MNIRKFIAWEERKESFWLEIVEKMDENDQHKVAQLEFEEKLKRDLRERLFYSDSFTFTFRAPTCKNS